MSFSVWCSIAATNNLRLNTVQLFFFCLQQNAIPFAKRHYPWTEVDDPVKLYNQAGLSLLEAEIRVLDAGAGSEQAPGETTGLPDAHLALQVAPVLVFCGLIWRWE